MRIEDGLPISERVLLKARPKIHITREKPAGLRRFLVPALVLLVLTIAAEVAWRFLLPKSAVPFAKVENSIAIISFENQTGWRRSPNQPNKTIGFSAASGCLTSGVPRGAKLRRSKTDCIRLPPPPPLPS